MERIIYLLGSLLCGCASIQQPVLGIPQELPPLLVLEYISPTIVPEVEKIRADLHALAGREIIGYAPLGWVIFVSQEVIDIERKGVYKSTAGITFIEKHVIVIAEPGYHFPDGTKMPEDVTGILAHEIGHAMGLEHSKYVDSLMFSIHLGQCFGREAECLFTELRDAKVLL